jgi:hypothetical protein
MPLSGRSRIGVQARLPRFPILPDHASAKGSVRRIDGNIRGIAAVKALVQAGGERMRLAANMVSPWRGERCPDRFVRLWK